MVIATPKRPRRHKSEDPDMRQARWDALALVERDRASDEIRGD
jgi:hypothetical protein